MIFSLLNVRKKTAASIAGITIGALCLWGVALWQNISLEELANVLLGTVLMLGGIILVALLLIATAKGLGFLFRLARNKSPEKSD